MNFIKKLLLIIISANSIFCNNKKKLENQELNLRKKLIQKNAEEISEVLIKNIIDIYLAKELAVNVGESFQKIKYMNDFLVKQIHKTDKFLLEKEQDTFSSKINNLRKFNNLISTIVQLSIKIKRQNNIGNVLFTIKEILRELNKYIINDEIIYQTENSKLFVENQMKYFCNLFIEISIKKLNISITEEYKFSFSINQTHDCIACSNEYKLQQNNCLLVTSCGHYCCNNCAVKWVIEQERCPVCRENLKKPERCSPY